MKNHKVMLLVLILIMNSIIVSQTITGKLLDQTSSGISGAEVKLYSGTYIYTSLTSSDGTFVFNNIVGIEKEELPSGYMVSNNYPNPFNPKTRIEFTMPNGGSVKVDIYNSVGQKVEETIEKYYGGGANFIDLELNGLPNGLYIVRIMLDGKYSVTRKIMLLYGSNHLNASIGVPTFRINKSPGQSNSALSTRIDSIVATGASFGKKVFTNLPSHITGTLNLGSFSITVPAPNAPVLSTPANSSVDQSITPTLSWNQVSGATSYTLQVSTDNSFSSFIYNQRGLTGTSQQVTGLNNLTAYHWRVSASNSYGTSVWSNAWSFTTIGTAPTAPVLSAPANNATGQSITPSLAWNAALGAASYTLQVSSDNTFSSFIYNQSGLTGTSQQVTGLNNLTAYHWRVSASNSYGTSVWSNAWSFTTIGTAPTAPVLSAPANNATGQSITPSLAWNAALDAASYTLQVSTDNTFSSFIYNQSGLTGTSRAITGLQGLTSYYWRVSAANSYGTSVWSNTWTFTTAGTAPGAPVLTSPLNGAVDVSLTPLLSWNQVDGAATYELQVSSMSSFLYLMSNITGLTTNTRQLNNLINSTTYYWRVRAVNSYGTSEWTNGWSFTTIANNWACGNTITYAGKTYNTIQIGLQCWLKENLDVGTMINGSLNQLNNGVIEKYCYNDDANNCAIYGGLYQWNEMMQYSYTPGTMGICPSGFHLPTDDELNTLKASVGNSGNALKAVGQGSGAGTGTNTSGFSGLLAGGWDNFSGFRTINVYGYVQSSTFRVSGSNFEFNYLYLTNTDNSIQIINVFNVTALSVRCLKD